MDVLKRLLAAAQPQASLLAALALASAMVGYLLYSEEHAKWATVPASSGLNVKQDVVLRVESLRESTGTLRPSVSLEILGLLTAERKHVRFHIAEIEFREGELHGAAGLGPIILDKATLVNSVDEYRRNNGGISRYIGEGCQLSSLDESRPPQQIGEVVIENCNRDAPYFRHGVQRVASVALILWRDDGARAICKRNSSAVDGNGFSTDGLYRECIGKSAEIALTGLFRKLAEADRSSAILLPALATGTGALHPETMYQAYQKVLKERLTTPEAAAQLPENIVFLFHRAWTPSQLDEHTRAVANLTEELYHTWSERSTKYRQTGALATLLGILCGLTFLALLTMIGKAFFDGSVFGIQTELPMALLGWGLAAQGAVTTVQAILGRVVGTGTVGSFVLGLVAIWAAWYRARQQRFRRYRKRRQEGREAAPISIGSWPGYRPSQ